MRRAINTLSASRTRVGALAATLMATAGVASTEGGASSASYVYSPPARASEARAAIALEAAKPRVRVPLSPLPRVIFVLGGPGAGKGTQCAKLVEEFGFVHLSAGDLLREERDSGSPDGAMIEDMIRNGAIVPVEVTVKLIQKAMVRSGATKFLIDGFPRNADNVRGWEQVVGDAAVVDGVLKFDVPEEVMTARLLERGKTSGRSDDNHASVLKRLQTYAESTMPVIDAFAAKGKLVVVDGNRDKDAVFADTRAAVQGTLTAEVLSFNQLLLDSICAGDWAAYASLCDPTLTCFEPEAAELGLVHGLGFHQTAFEEGARGRARAALAGAPVEWSASTMAAPTVRFLGPRSALVTYVRHSSPLLGGAVVSRVAETRVWQLVGNAWRLQHLHRSPMPPLGVEVTRH